MSTTVADEEASISLPSIAFVTILGFLLYRYFFGPSSSSSSTATGSGSSSSRGTTPRFTTQQVDQVAQMFPQLNRRDIMWDLHRNRGNVQATTNRILSNGRLEPAPPTFQPTLLTPTSLVSGANGGTGAGISSTTTSSTSKPTTTEPDLITRYSLQSRVSASDKGKGKESAATAAETTAEDEQGGGGGRRGGPAPAGSGGWASSREERQNMLKRRRDEMILAARRKMQERDAAQGTTSIASSVPAGADAVPVPVPVPVPVSPLSSSSDFS